MRNRHRWGLLGLLLLAAPVAHAAAPAGDALLIGVDGPDPGGGCLQTAAAAGDALGQLGLTVHSLANPSVTSLRDALDAFADETGGTPGGTNLIYVCAPAVAEGPRLFVLPSTSGGVPLADARTGGVVLQALLNALAGTGGTLYADLLVAGDVDGEHRPRLPDGLRLALNEDAKNQPHLLGTALSASGFPLGQGWTAAAAALRPVGHGLILAPDTPLAAASAAESPSLEAPPAATPLAPSGTPPGGHESWARTGAGNGERRSWHPRPAAVPGANLPASSRTARIQTALARRGTYPGPIDGKYAPAVAEAVRSFQRQLGDLPTGVLTRSEIVQLLNS